MTVGAYTEVPAFAYPGWRLTVPGGPAGGHYKGFTHTQAAGTDILPQDEYEQDREDGMSSHDAVHASPRNPRGVYRSAAEVPPRPNASGQAMTYRSFQTERHAGTSVAPGSFPAQFDESEEDSFLSGLGYDVPISEMRRVSEDGTPQSQLVAVGFRPNTAYCVPQDDESQTSVWDVNTCRWIPRTGATSVVRQPAGSLMPLPPSPSVPVVTDTAISPRPSPVVSTNQVVPDGRGNFVNLSTGETIPADGVEQNPATGQLTASKALSWLEEHSIFSALPNWGVIAAGVLAASLFMGKHR